MAGRLASALRLERIAVGQALESYVSHSLAGKVQKIETLYMTRMYDDNPNYMRMKFAGIGTLAVDQICSSFDLFRGAVNGKLIG